MRREVTMGEAKAGICGITSIAANVIPLTSGGLESAAIEVR